MTGDGGPTRRRLLAGAVGAAGLAGCLDGGAIDEEVADDPDAFGLPFPYLPEAAQLNPWAGSYPWAVHALFFESRSLSGPAEDRRPTGPIATVAVEGETATVSYEEGFRWWNGEPVTARDQWIEERIGSYVRAAEGSEVEGGDVDADDAAVVADRLGTGVADVTLVDDVTLRYEFDRPLARSLVVERVLPGVHNVAAWRFEPWLESMGDATTDDEREAIVAELRGATIPLEEAIEEGYGCGPYELAEASPNRLICDRFEDHPQVGDLEIPRLWLPVAMDQKEDELTADGSIDGGIGLLEERRVGAPDGVEQLASHPTDGGMKLVLDWRNPHLARRGVRRALLAALPVPEIVSQAGWGDPAAVQTGLTAPNEERWIEREDYRRYPVEADEKRAAKYLREAGYEREGRYWHDADGERLGLRLRTPMWEGWLAATRYMEIELEAFGIGIELLQSPNTTVFGFVEDADFDLLPWWTDGHPYRAYDVVERDLGTLGYALDAPEEWDPTADDSRLDKPLEPAIPVEPASEERERVDLREQWRRLSAPGDEDRREAVATFARWWNDDLPDIDLATGVTGVWGDTREFSWPEGDDPRYRRTNGDGRPDIELLKTGAIGRS